MSTSAEEQHRTTQARLQRAFRLEIVLPAVVALLAIIALTIVAGVIPRTSVVADWMMTVLLLCPALLCLFPLYVLLVAAVYGAGKAYAVASRPLAQLEQLSTRIRERTQRTGEQVARQTINASAQIAPLQHTLDHAFDPHSHKPGNEA